MKALRVFAVAVVAGVTLAACGGTAGSGSGGVDRNKGSKGSLTIADAGFTESEVMANMYADVLAKAGYKTTETSVKASEVFQKSLESGDVAVVPEYVATYADQLNQLTHGANAASVASPDLTKSLAALKKLAGPRGLSVLQPSKAVDQNAFAVSRKFAKQYNLKTLSDLGRSGAAVKIAAGAECATRPFCATGLRKTYGIKVATKIDPLGVDTTQSKQAVQQGADQLALVLTTDATVTDFDLVVLKDDKKLQNADYLVPIVNTKKLKPAISKALNNLSARLTTSELAQLNEKVDKGQQKPADVASAFLKSKGLV